MSIYIQNFRNEENIYDFLNNNFSVPFHNTQHKFVMTYKDEYCSIMDCHEARRSFEDLLEICQTYYPETTEEELAKTLFELHKKDNLQCLFCPDILKIVFIKWYPEHRTFYRIVSGSHMGATALTKGNSRYSIGDIYELAGKSTEKD